MKHLDPALASHLASGTTTLCWCWRITRKDGAVFGFTDHDRPLTFVGTSFEAEAGFAASEIRSGSDLAADAQDAEGVLSSDMITETDILDGRWDDAAVELWRVNWADPSQRVLMQRGSLGQIRRGRMAFIVEIRSMSHPLNQPIGRTYQYGCDAELGDSRCGAGVAVGTGAVVALQRGRCFSASGLGLFEAGWFAFGLLVWATGPNAGREAEVMMHSVDGADVRLTLLEEPVQAITPGDTFDVRPGCDKCIETCAAKFANAVNFRGFPDIPGQDTVLRWATKSRYNTGEPL